MKVLKLEPNAGSNESLGGIRENPSFDGRVRELPLFDTHGERVALVFIPDHNLTPRVTELLDEIIAEVQRHRWGGGPVKVPNTTLPNSSAS